MGGRRLVPATRLAGHEPKARETPVSTVGWGLGSGATPEQMLASLRAASDHQAAMLKAIGFEPE